MKWLRKLRELMMGHPAAPDDERSIKAEHLRDLTTQTERVVERVDRLTPPTRVQRIRREAMLAEAKFKR